MSVNALRLAALVLLILTALWPVRAACHEPPDGWDDKPPQPYREAILINLPLSQPDSYLADQSPNITDTDSPRAERRLVAPDDPCLPKLYRDWQELALDEEADALRKQFVHIRVSIDRATFRLCIEGLRHDGSAEEVYRTPVALGDVNTPTPDGTFFINHVYCYPDVFFFHEVAGKVPYLYNGFFAPLLLCDESGRCQRHRELGIHGFMASAYPNRHSVVPATYGAVSGGCIRLPDPCRFKRELIRLAGLGPLKRNDRGCYHWLKRPVEVIIAGDYPGAEEQVTLLSSVEQGASEIQQGVRGLLEYFFR